MLKYKIHKIICANRIMWTNKTHHFLLLYFNRTPLHVSSRLAAHHQEDKLIESSASCGFMLCGYITTHGQQNIKNICAKFTW